MTYSIYCVSILDSQSIVGKKIHTFTPKHVHVLIPRTHEYVAFHDKEKLRWQTEIRLQISWLWDGETFLNNVGLPNIFARGRDESQCQSDAAWERSDRPLLALKKEGEPSTSGSYKRKGHELFPLNYRRNIVLLILWFMPSETNFGLLTSRNVRKKLSLLFSIKKFIKICYSNSRNLIQSNSTIFINVYNRSKNRDYRRI